MKLLSAERTHLSQWLVRDLFHPITYFTGSACKRVPELTATKTWILTWMCSCNITAERGNIFYNKGGIIKQWIRPVSRIVKYSSKSLKYYCIRSQVVCGKTPTSLRTSVSIATETLIPEAVTYQYAAYRNSSRREIHLGNKCAIAFNKSGREVADLVAWEWGTHRKP